MASKKFSELSPMHQGLMLAILPLVLAAIVFYEFVSPLGQKVTSLKAQLSTLHAQNLRGRMLETQRGQLIERIAAAQKELDALRQIVPDSPADDQFIKGIYSLATASGVHVRSMVAEPSVRETYYTEMPFRLRMDGTYYGVLDFFTRLASSSRIVNVSDLFLGSPKATGGKGSYKVEALETVGADCILTTFFSSPPPPPSTAGKIRR